MPQRSVWKRSLEWYAHSGFKILLNIHLWPILCTTFFSSWWRHPMEIFSALLAIYAGNSPIFFDMCLNKRLSKQSWGWWLETPSKFLGVIIDNKLNWKPHIRYVGTKVAKGIGIILKARKVFNHETLSTLYYTFVYPYLNYCIHVWGRAYNTHLKDLSVLQNKIIRIINGIPPRTNVDHLYIQQNILSVNRLYYYNIGIFMYKFSNSMLPEMFDSFFSKIEDTHSYHTRQSSAKHLYVNFRSTSRGQRSCIYSSAIIWNCILDNFNPECAIGLFKKQSQALFLNSKCDFFTWRFFLP